MTIAEVVEPAQDLAVADRVAFVRARLTGRTHAVVATTHTYVVVRADHELEGTDASELRQPAGAPRLISIATPDYVTPALAPLVAQFGHHCTTTVPSQHTSQN